ncbi:MAG: sulfurtransferase [Nocardioidaceae bacterium]
MTTAQLGQPVLIAADELQVELAGDKPPVVLDVRWQLGGPPGHSEYLQGHIPGAVYVDLDTELASRGEPAAGRHPLPDPADFQDSMRRWGINADSAVVVYDGEGNLSSARAWWLLRWAGHRDVRLLDGALPAWLGAGGELATGDVRPSLGNAVVAIDETLAIDADAAASWPTVGVLLDARAAERFRGEVEPVDPVAGHIPGASSAPTGKNLASDGRFLSRIQLQERFGALGVDGKQPVAVYCGSGVTAAHEVAALAVAGIDARLYPGSWSQWSNSGREVAVGDEA